MSAALQVLHLDDDPAYLDHAARTLGPLGFSLTSAQQVEGAPIDGPWDLILLDLSIPPLRGLEVLRAVQAQLPQAPIVVLTGAADEAQRRDALAHGAAGWLFKDQLRADQVGAAAGELRRLAATLRAPAALAADDESTETRGERAPGLPAVKYGRVLVVEDEPALADRLLEAFRRARIATDHAASLAAALAILDRADDPTAAVILDLTLEDASGLHALRQIKRTRPLVYLTVVTGDSSNGLRDEGLLEGARRWFVKPCRIEDLVDATRQDLIYRRGSMRRRSSEAPSLEEALAAAAATGSQLLEDLEGHPELIAAQVVEALGPTLQGAIDQAVDQAATIAARDDDDGGEISAWSAWLRDNLGKWIKPQHVDRLVGALAGALTALGAALAAWWGISGGTGGSQP